MYRTYHFVIKKKSELFNYFEDMCMKSKNLWTWKSYFAALKTYKKNPSASKRAVNAVHTLNCSFYSLLDITGQDLRKMRRFHFFQVLLSQV